MIRKLKEKLLITLYKSIYKPGHFYSPIPNLKEILDRQQVIFAKEDPLDIDLRVNEQLTFLNNSIKFYQRFPFKQNKDTGFRYYYNNDFFNVSDALAAFFVLNHYKPKQIIEVGSGFSSALMLDVSDHFLNSSIEFTFIEPFPDRLKSLLREEDNSKTKIQQAFVQDVDKGVFSHLIENDILFIDSSHISKVGSDLNFILFNILPVLKKGVIIHFHDICYPFEYPKEWIEQGIHWNEAYLLRAFLMNNPSYKILLFNNYLFYKHMDWLKNKMPLFNFGGSLWLQKL